MINGRRSSRSKPEEIYEARLEPPGRTFREGQRVLTTPSTRVTNEQLGAEFDKIGQFPRIGLDDEPELAE